MLEGRAAGPQVYEGGQGDPGNEIKEKAKTGGTLALFPAPVPAGDASAEPQPPSTTPLAYHTRRLPADGLCDGRLALQDGPPGLTVGRGDTGGLGGHTHTPQESLASQGLGGGVAVRRLDRAPPQPLPAGAYLEEARLLRRWGHHRRDVQPQPGWLLALQAAGAVPAGLAHGAGGARRA